MLILWIGSIRFARHRKDISVAWALKSNSRRYEIDLGVVVCWRRGESNILNTCSTIELEDEDIFVTWG